MIFEKYVPGALLVAKPPFPGFRLKVAMFRYKEPDLVYLSIGGGNKKDVFLYVGKINKKEKATIKAKHTTSKPYKYKILQSAGILYAVTELQFDRYFSLLKGNQ